MLERMKRRGLLKAALGGAAAVALGEMGFGKQEAAALPDVCVRDSYVCSDKYGGTCNTTCMRYCSVERYRSCPMCADVLNGNCPAPTPQPTPDPCDFWNRHCSEAEGGICGLFCDWACTTYANDAARLQCSICQDRSC